MDTQKLASTLETLKSAPADNVSWWDAFEDHLKAGCSWEEAAKLAWRKVEIISGGQ